MFASVLLVTVCVLMIQTSLCSCSNNNKGVSGNSSNLLRIISSSLANNSTTDLKVVNGSAKENKAFVELYARSVSDYLEDMSLMQLPSKFRPGINLRVRNYQPDFGELLHKYGSTVCSQSEVEKTEFVTYACPWHHELRLRTNIYPHRRLNAVCNCQDGCLAKIPGYDASYSRCEQVFTYMPAMIKTLSESGSPEWTFFMEQVPTACVCRLRTKIYN